MEIVIKIPEKTVNEIKDNAMFAYSISNDIRWDVTSAIVNCVQLPKGHGRLIECERLQEVFRRNVVGYAGFKKLFDNAPTLIGADKESEKV